MRLPEQVKKAIEAEYASWMDEQYVGKDKAERQKLAQFFTPPALSIKMLEKLDSLEGKDILDPALGAGGLIAAAVLAGADPKRCFGIEIDEEVLAVARRRLAKLGVPPCNLVLGDALDPKSYEEKLQPFSAEVFAVVTKIQDGVFSIVVVKHGKPPKEAVCTRDKANEVLKKIKSKGIQIFKI